MHLADFVSSTEANGSGRVPQVRTSVPGPKKTGAQPLERFCYMSEGRLPRVSVLVFHAKQSQTDAICLFSAESFSPRSTRSAMSATNSATLATAALPRER
jgi:hypothetical protein